MVRLLYGVVGVLIACTLSAEQLPVEYEIAVELDTQNHRLSGTERIRWTNTGSLPTSEMWFHLYLNAFANDRTTFMSGLDGRTFLGRRGGERQWGWIRVVALESETGVDLLPSLTFERPDDGNLEDFTVARVLLDRPVSPGSSATVDLTFEAQLPGVIARTGWAGDFHLVGQWFPKLGVFETAGHGGRSEAGWNCHQYHSSTEFYADFSRYRVQVTVPEGFVVGATGVQIEETPKAEGGVRKRTVTFTADRVHDFAWCAAPSQMMTTVESDFDPGRDVPVAWLERAISVLGLSSADLELPPVHLRLLLPTTQVKLADRMLTAARLGLAWYGLFYGAYPYPQLTIVSPPPGAEESAGMEYPTFITTGATKLMEFPPLSWLGAIEGVTVHEFGHQYFQGMVASNEFEQAWLDEGLNSYSEASCMQAIQSDGLVPELRFSNPWSSKRLFWALREKPLQVDSPASKFRTRRDFGAASYNKTALTLKTLEGLVGEQAFARALRSYVRTWSFRHPTGMDFRAALTESLGGDYTWFFSQALDEDSIVDWSVAGVVQREKRAPSGMLWDGTQWQETSVGGEPSDDAVGEQDTVWSIHADIQRLGSFRGPVDVSFFFADGHEERRTWDGQDRWVRYRFERSRRLTGVVVDPACVWALEGKREDNYWRDGPGSNSADQHIWWASAAMRLITLAVQPWS